MFLFIGFISAPKLFSQTFSNGTNVAIPDNNTFVTSVIAVSGLSTSINCTTLGLQSVCVKIAHTWDEDLDIFLLAPDGTQIPLSTDNGGSGDHYGNNAANDLGPYTCFDMSAATNITAGASPFAGTYIPEGLLGNVNNGQNPNGNWTLRVRDDAAGDNGTILYWQLTFATTSLPCPPLGNDCATPIVLTPGAAGAGCTSTSGTTATGYTGSGIGCSTGTNDDDIFYSFVATSTSHTVIVDGNANFDAVIAVFNACGGANLSGCLDATGGGGIESTTVTGLTIGNTYIVQVYDYDAAGGAFTICVTTPGPPQCAVYTSPSDGEEMCATSTNLTWTAGSGDAPTSYVLYFGTNNPPTNIVNGTNIGNVTSYATGALTVGTTYYWQIIPVNALGSASNCALQSFSVVNCVTQGNGSTTTCNSNYYDSGGESSGYTNNQNTVHTVCPSVPGECVTAVFYDFETEGGFDYLYIYDGNTTGATQIVGSPFSGSLGGFAVNGTVGNATGCLTFQFISDGLVTGSGWDASLSCAPCGSTPAYPPQDCEGGTTVCSDQSFSGNSSGDGFIDDLNNSNNGCLSVEHQSSWYYFSPLTTGTIQLSINPANGTDDYDFAIWGPMVAIACPPGVDPIRCSYSSLGGNTGLNLTATDVSEGVGGDKWVDELSVIGGEIYIMVIDNYSSSSQPFTFDWTLTNGATLDCTILPMELISFGGKINGAVVDIEWITSSENNTDYFIVERSTDGINFTELIRKNAVGNSSVETVYKVIDPSPLTGKNYYRLMQVDINGAIKKSGLAVVDFGSELPKVDRIFPNPSNGELNLDVYAPQSGNVLIQYMDYTGRVVKEEYRSIEKGHITLQSSIQDLAIGIYSLKLVFEADGTVIVNKIIRN